MKLYIDTRDSEKIVVGVGGRQVVTDSRQEKAQMLLGVIDEQLKKRKKSLKDIKEIEVEVGPGSFTGLRVGVSVANALGWVLALPVNGKKVCRRPVVPRYQ